jgi:hypothetical protein
MTKSPVMSRIGNPNVNTAIGKVGSRAVPRMTPMQILMTRTGPAPPDNEAYDVENFEDV